MPAGEPNDVRRLREAAARRAAGPVWVTWRHTRRLPSDPPTGRGVRARLVRRLRDWWEGPWDAVGLLDLANNRYALDLGHFSLLHIDGQEWRGRSGSRTEAKRYAHDDPDRTPLDLLDAARTARAVTESDDSTLGLWALELDGKHRHWATLRGGELVEVVRRDPEAPDGRIDRVLFHERADLPDFPVGRLPDWNSDTE